MIAGFYLYVSDTGGTRITKRENDPNGNEIRAFVMVTIPDAYFERYMPVLSITLPEPESLPEPEVAVNGVAVANPEDIGDDPDPDA